MKKIFGLAILLFSLDVSADRKKLASYISWDKAGTVITGPMYGIDQDVDKLGISSCNGRYPPYSVRIIDEISGEEKTFVCEEVNTQE